MFEGSSSAQWGIQRSLACDRCRLPTVETWFCSACNVAGHAECLLPQLVAGYAFCGACVPWAQAQVARMTSAAQRERWTSRLASQLAAWASASLTATGTMEAAGLAVGAVAATAAAAPAALMRGVVTGARVASGSAPAQPRPAGEPQALGGYASEPVGEARASVPRSGLAPEPSQTLPSLPAAGSAEQSAPPPAPQGAAAGHGEVPPPPPPHPATAERLRRTRTTPAGAASSSHPSASSWAPKCVACWTENREHVAHTYADDCVVQSGRRIYGQAPQNPSLSTPEGPPSSYQSLPDQPELSPQAHQNDPHAQYTSSSQHDATRSAQNADTQNDSARGGGAHASSGCSSDPCRPSGHSGPRGARAGEARQSRGAEQSEARPDVQPRGPSSTSPSASSPTSSGPPGPPLPPYPELVRLVWQLRSDLQILRAEQEQSRSRADGAEATAERVQIAQADQAEELQLVTARSIQLVEAVSTVEADLAVTTDRLGQLEQEWASWGSSEPQPQQPEEQQQPQFRPPTDETQTGRADGLEEMLGSVMEVPTVSFEGAQGVATPSLNLAAEDSSEGPSPRELLDPAAGSPDAWTRWYEALGPQTFASVSQGGGLTHHFRTEPPAAALQFHLGHSFDQHAHPGQPGAGRTEADNSVMVFHVPADMQAPSRQMQRAAGASSAAGLAGATSATRRATHSPQGSGASVQHTGGAAQAMSLGSAPPPSFGGGFPQVPVSANPLERDQFSTLQGHPQLGAQSVFPGLVPSPRDRQPASSPPGLSHRAAAREPSTGDMNLLLKFLGQMGDLPKLDLGGSEGRGEKLVLWRVALETQLRSACPLVVGWWGWVWLTANACYKQWLNLPPPERNQLKIQATAPLHCKMIEDWFYPRRSHFGDPARHPRAARVRSERPASRRSRASHESGFGPAAQLRRRIPTGTGRCRPPGVESVLHTSRPPAVRCPNIFSWPRPFTSGSTASFKPTGLVSPCRRSRAEH